MEKGVAAGTHVHKPIYVPNLDHHFSYPTSAWWKTRASLAPCFRRHGHTASRQLRRTHVLHQTLSRLLLGSVALVPVGACYPIPTVEPAHTHHQLRTKPSPTRIERPRSQTCPRNLAATPRATNGPSQPSESP
eukprot:1195976-Prorocentrum_minimum.AAC.7